LTGLPALYLTCYHLAVYIRPSRGPLIINILFFDDDRPAKNCTSQSEGDETGHWQVQRHAHRLPGGDERHHVLLQLQGASPSDVPATGETLPIFSSYFNDDAPAMRLITSIYDKFCKKLVSSFVKLFYSNVL